MDLLAWWVSIETAKNVGERLERLVAMTQKRNRFILRTIDFGQLDHEVAQIKAIYADAQGAWSENWGHVPMTDHEVDHIVNGLKQFADPDFIYVAEVDGKATGVSISLPNVNRPLRKAYPSPNVPELWTLAKFLWYRRSMVNSMRVLIMGVLKEHRMAGIEAVMMKRMLDAAIRKGYIGGEMSWILETNDAMNRLIKLCGAEVYKTYRIYDFAIG
jgi:hypothetical protein